MNCKNFRESSSKIRMAVFKASANKLVSINFVDICSHRVAAKLKENFIKTSVFVN